MEIDHVGVATDDAAALAARYEALFDATPEHEEVLDGLTVTFLDTDPPLELLEPPAEGDGPVARALDRRGPGLHHVALRTDDLADALSTAESVGVALVDETPRAGARGHAVAFLHPADTGGVLIELVAAD